MNKRLPFILALFLFCAGSSKAQYDCNNNRFLEEVFSNVEKTADINYGSAVTVISTTENLLLDVYEPTGDTMQARPLIIWAHGGSFVFGNKESADIVTLCNKYSRQGYVTASINYRLGFGGILPTSTSAIKTVYRATADMRAAVRYFYKDASTTNQFKIDTNNIFVGGVSAGAFIALHLAYLDQESEIPPEVDPVEFGGIEGNSGNPGYSSNVKAIVNLCGALGDTAWIGNNDIPCLSMHGTNDDVVPYGTAVINVFSIPLFEVDGSASVARRQTNTGTEHIFVTWPGAIHTPFIGTPAYMDSVFMAVTPFLANRLGCDVPLVTETVYQAENLVVYPNPARSELRFNNELNQPVHVSMFDASGRIALKTMSDGYIDVSSLDKGLYVLQIQSERKIKTARVILN